MFEKVEFKTGDGTILRGRVYRPENATAPTPIVVMCGGFGSIVEVLLEPFALRFAEAGLAVLLYDHRNFGYSDGPIRQETDPFQQVADLRDAVTFAQGLPGIDPERVGAWGSSYSGGHVLFLAATDRRVKCVVSQVPFISGSETMARNVRPDFLGMTRSMFAADRAARMAGQAPMLMPLVTAEPLQPAVLPSPDAYEFTVKHMEGAPTFQNAVTVRSMELAGAYEPGAYIAGVSPTPLLMIVGLEDAVTVPDLALEAYERANQPKELVLLKGGHFDPYVKEFEVAGGAATNWFARHLL